MMLQRVCAAALGGRGRERKLSTLIFHRVRAQPEPAAPLALDAARFDRLLEGVGRAFNVIAPDEAVERLAIGALPPRALTITFDDGYADNAEVALPILRRRGMSAAFFVATDYLDGGVMWNDKVALALRAAPGGPLDLGALGLGAFDLADGASRRKAIGDVIARVKYLAPERRREVVDALVERSGVELPHNLMMTRAQVRELRSAGMVVGGHTCSHPILASLEPGTAEAEIARNKAVLEDLLGEPVTLFAYPNGVPGRDYRREHVEMVRRAGYRAAFTTGWGVSRRDADPYQLARFTPWDRTSAGFVWRLVGNLARSARPV